MKTITDFKRKLAAAKQSGATVSTKLFWIDKGEYKQVNEINNRKVLVIQSNSFALSMERDGKQVPGWCDWPKKDEFCPVNDNEAYINFEGGRLHYKFD